MIQVMDGDGSQAGVKPRKPHVIRPRSEYTMRLACTKEFTVTSTGATFQMRCRLQDPELLQVKSFELLPYHHRSVRFEITIPRRKVKPLIYVGRVLGVTLVTGNNEYLRITCEGTT